MDNTCSYLRLSLLIEFCADVSRFVGRGWDVRLFTQLPRPMLSLSLICGLCLPLAAPRGLTGVLVE